MAEERYASERARIEQGHVKYRDKLKEEGKLFVRDRLRLLLDPGSEFQEDFLFARNQEADTPADGVVTGVGRVGGRLACIMANDYTVKAGSWGEKTVAKIVRIQERAQRLQVPLLYLVDAAGGRISEQIKIFPGRFHAGRIFYNEVQLSGVVPQVCILFGPSPAGSAYLPALTDCVIMVDGKASLYVGSPRMVEMAGGEKCRSRSWGERACTAPSPAAVTSWPPPTRRPSRSPSAISPSCRRPIVSGPPRWPRASRRRGARWTRSSPTTSASGSTCTSSSAVWSTRAPSSRSSGSSLRRSSPASRASAAEPRASWPTNPRSRVACSWSTPRTRRHASSGCATRSTSPSSTSPM